MRIELRREAINRRDKKKREIGEEVDEGGRVGVKEFINNKKL